jgi:formate hydrogenlyase transcriptional activator
VQAVESIRCFDQDRAERRFEQIIGTSPALEAVLKQVECVAPTDSTVLIEGETGTGKELIARAVHNLSHRCGRPFIKLNCAAIPFDLLESELFGHAKGAFTGAVAQRIGRFELADKGTLFLDEVGDMPLGLQPKLLRVLQEQEIERLGSTQTYRVNVRLVAATNHDLASMVEQGRFREDLYYRLNVFPVHLPPLRERPADIPQLALHFVQRFSQLMNKEIQTIPDETMEAFFRYKWPGNIREMQNVIERAVILSTGSVLQVPLEYFRSRAAHLTQNANGRTLADAEREHILATLRETEWVLSGPNGAATRLGINRSTLQFRMRKLGIVRPNSMWTSTTNLGKNNHASHTEERRAQLE